MSEQMREARRRRILENSEKRLQKIMGLVSAREEDSQTPETADQIPNSKHDLESKIQDQPDAPKPEPQIQNHYTHTVEEPQIRQRHTYPEPPSDFISSEPLGEDIQVQDAFSTNTQQPKKNKNIVLSLLAFISIILLSLDFGILIGHNVLLPFSLYEIYLYRQQIQSQQQSFISVIFMLSGLPQEMVKNIDRNLSSLLSILQDLCLYLYVAILGSQIIKYE